jgi:hypothetical protein
MKPPCDHSARYPAARRGRLFRHADNEDAILGRLQTISTVAPTVPANGDVNPCSVTLVPRPMGDCTAGTF